MAHAVKKHEIKWEKLIIGPITTVGEMSMGGHWLEMLKVQRQSGTYANYSAAARDMWKQLGFKGFYKGFFPGGFIQGLYKGLPVLFIQGEANYQLNARGLLHGTTAQVVAGMSAGVVQGAMVAPTQRVKVMVATNPKAGAVSLDTVIKVVRAEGAATIFKGTHIMMARRGIDWGLRFYGNSTAKDYFKSRKQPGQKLSALEIVFSGMFGGAFSAFNQPLDVWVANAQRHREGRSLTGAEVFKELVAESKVRGIAAVWFRGVGMRMVHSAYHTAWMVGLGSWISNQYRAMAGDTSESDGGMH